ncbi:MAG TPA: sugar ABC transporter ATP-binding protein [Eubacteriales bacterium]|nr:sugar ABC transporter ATP-binding protein [Eubacteriales bacterium]
MDNRETILDIQHITKTFPGVRALNDVSFQVKRGSVHALVGENGAGKSTLINVLTGVYHPDGGRYFFKGKEAHVTMPLEAQMLGISVVHQELKLSETLSVAENIFLGRPFLNKARLVDWRKLRAEASELLDSLNIRLNVDTEVAHLSVAQKQIVEICKALSFNAEMIIMDEPSATLTDKELDSLFHIIDILKERGVTIVYISHRMEEIFRIADTVTVLRDGGHVGTMPVADVNREKLISMMVGRTLGEEYPKLKAEIGEIALEVRNLSAKKLLHDISFNVRHGEIVGISGLVGAGRTETARAVFGADKRATGEIFIDGEPVKINSVIDAVRNKIALVPEDRKKQGLVLIHSIKHNVSLVNLKNVCKRGLLNDELERRMAEKFIEVLNIVTPSGEKEVRLLSGGNQQKVVLAKWLAVDSKIIILDEPTRGVDVGAKAEIYKLMCRLAQDGKAVVMISSDLPELIGVCDRIYVMREGTISGELEREDFSQERILSHAVS